MRSPMAAAVACLSSFCWLACDVEADDLATRSVPFCLPQVRLREEGRAKPAQPDLALSTQPIPSASTESAALESDLSDGGLHSRVLRTGEFYLTRPEGPAKSGLGGYVDGLFTPEVVRIGKATVSSPILTIIKRGNPLCLLSGFGTDRSLISYILLQVSW